MIDFCNESIISCRGIWPRKRVSSRL